MEGIMFCRVDVVFDKPIYTIDGGLVTFTGLDENGDTKGIFYNKIWTPEPENYFKIIPERYRKDFHLNIMAINHAIPPHTDTEIITTINFYFETGGAKTVFYDVITNNPKTTQIENQTDGFIYYEEDLKEVSSFVAKDHEVWVLDVKKVHSVVGNVKMRKAITLGTKIHNYENVVNMIKENGYEVYKN